MSNLIYDPLFNSFLFNTYYSRQNKPDASLVPPIRQTASIFKQPVTVHKFNNESKINHELKPSTHDKPKQIFWEKRLEVGIPSKNNLYSTLTG